MSHKETLPQERLNDMYVKRVQSFTDQQLQLSKKKRLFSYGRLGFFLLWVASIIVLFQIHWLWGVLSIYIGFTCFYFIVKAHNAVSRRSTIVSRITDINKQELRVLDYDFSFLPNGNQFKDESHPYTNDLDIFGQHSLFQFITRCQTDFGETILASFLRNGVNQLEIPSYQGVIKEVSDLLEWRQEYQAICQSDIQDSTINAAFIDWMGKDSGIKFRIGYCLLIPLCTLILLFIFIKYLPWLSYFLAFVPAGLFTFHYSNKITQFQADASQHSKTLKHFAEAIQWISSHRFLHPLIIEKQDLFQDEYQDAYKQIKKLSYILHQLDLRHNFFGIMVNLFFPWDYYWANRLQQWKDKNRSHVKEWFETIGWFEAISSLSNLSYQNPNWVFPTIHSEQVMNARDLGHPLIHPSQRVSNDFSSPTRQHIKIVTGSNMGGKSTFLRTIGINIVLAKCGSKVCASLLDLPYLQLFTSMRTLDALEENTSSFYAELKRLKLVLDAVDRDSNVYFLLDEILKGTNSNDRHAGAKALITGLLEQNGAGLISTHDLELGLMASNHPDRIENICFEVQVINDELFFDYKLKKGVSKSFNATHLMRNMGIKI